MPAKPVTVTEAVRHFSDYVNRVAYRRESFLLCRGKRAMAELRPVPSARRLGDLPGILEMLPALSAPEAKAFLKDVRAARKSLPAENLRDPWES
ncbi:MAG: hypothetical protein NTW86_06410 [Candidatus Sumerlaeota bacterium]|nr:hypothetical protein [Candidatus Sumerlaeota bacterium]